jgi:DNA-3-methyladenine glycosylase II
MQFSTRKAEYLIGLAGAIADGKLDLAGLAHVPDDEVIARLTALRGLGRWTAEWFLARGLGRPDVCPAGDLGVRRAVEALCFRGRACDTARVRRRALAWRPYRSLAVHYLLAGLRRARAAAAL